MSDVTLLRTLTRKSTLKYGYRHTQTVEQMLAERPYQLISNYYKLSAITFTDDILDELGITERIQKPGVATDEDWQRIRIPFGEKHGWGDGTWNLVLKRKARQNLRCIERKPKSYHQGKNHGR